MRAVKQIVQVLLGFGIYFTSTKCVKFINTVSPLHDELDEHVIVEHTHVHTGIQCARLCESVGCAAFLFEEIVTYNLNDCFRNASNLYEGLKSETWSGVTCQRWDTFQPHSHSNTDPAKYPEDTVTDAANYCRDPDGETYPWCYTIDPDIRWQFCNVPRCDNNIADEKCVDTHTYMGTRDITHTNILCQRWDSQTPHSHGYTNHLRFPDATLDDASNYCRDPGNNGATWCYTTDPSTRYEYCTIRMCHEGEIVCYNNPSHKSYMGGWSKTFSGKTCQKWDTQIPHTHLLTDTDFNDASMSMASNYCRDPDSRGYLWCYTTDPGLKWESCGIGKCTPANCRIYNITLNPIQDRTGYKFYKRQN